MQDDQSRRLTFSPATKEEEDWIHQGLAKFLSNEGIEQLLQDRHLVVSRGRRHEVCGLSTALWKLYQKISAHRHPYFLGLYLGELQHKTFQPSLHILPHLMTNQKENVTIIVTADGEQRFLYGQKLDSEHLKNQLQKLVGRKRVIVVNSLNEALGYGRLVISKAGKVGVKNQKDLGWYLRRGR